MRTVITGGHLITMDPERGDLRADLLIEDGVIAQIAPDLRAVADAEVIDATGRAVLPGLIDSHRHTWQAALRGIAAEWTLGEYLDHILGSYGPAFSAEDVYIGDLLGAREALAAGVTTLLDYNQVMNSPEHADAALGGLRESGIRAVYAPSLPRWSPPRPDADGAAIDREFARLRDAYVASNGLLSLALGVRSPETSSIDIAADEVLLARRNGLRIASHVGLGVLGVKTPSIAQLADRGLLGADMMFIHCSTSTDEELRMLAGSGASASISPRIEMLMGHGFPAAGRLMAAGVRPSLSIDVVTGVVGSLFAEMRATLEAETSRQHVEAIARGESLAKRTFSAHDVLELATIEGARALGLDGRTGSLTVGKDADVIVLNLDTPDLSPVNDWAASATQCTPANVEHVFVRGDSRKRDFQLVGVDAARDREQARQSADRLIALANRGA